MMPTQAACGTLTGNVEILTYGKIQIINALLIPIKFARKFHSKQMQVVREIQKSYSKQHT